MYGNGFRSRSPPQAKTVRKSSLTATQPTNRSRSAPNKNLTTESKKLTKTNPVPRGKTTIVDELCDDLATFIDTRPFLQTKSRQQLSDQLKSIKNLGTKYISSRIKNKSVAEEFWRLFNAFNEQAQKLFDEQKTRIPTAIAKNFEQLDQNLSDTKGHIDSSSPEFSKLETKILSLEASYESLFAGIDIASLSLFINDVKQVQKDLRTQFPSVFPSYQSGRNGTYEYNFCLSQIITLLNNTRELLRSDIQLPEKCDHFREALTNFIPDVPKQNVKRTQEPKLIHATKIPKSSPIKTRVKSDSSTSEEGPKLINKAKPRNVTTTKKPAIAEKPKAKNLSTQLQQLKKENAELQQKLTEAQASKKEKEARLKSLNEIEQMNSQVKTMKSYKFKSNDELDSAINAIKEKIQVQEDQMMKYHAQIETLLPELSKNDSELYEENLALRRDNHRILQKLLFAQLDCERLRSVVKHPKQPINVNSEEELEALVQLAQENNQQATQKHENYQREIESLMNKLEENIVIQHVDDEFMNTLDQLKDEIKDIEYQIISDQQTQQLEAIEMLQIQTETALQKCRVKCQADVENVLKEKAAIDNQYFGLRKALEDLKESNEEILVFNDEEYSFEEGREYLIDLGNQIKEYDDILTNMCETECSDEIKILKQEIESLNQGSQELSDWVSEIEQNALIMQSEVQTLNAEYSIVERLKSNPNFDIDTATNEIIDSTVAGNHKLKSILSEITRELDNLDSQLGGDFQEDVPIDLRLESIAKKLQQ